MFYIFGGNRLVAADDIFAFAGRFLCCRRHAWLQVVEVIIWTDATSYEQQTRKFQLFQCEILTGSIWFLKSYVKRGRKTVH